MRYSHLCLVELGVTDLRRSEAFYARLPGLEATGCDEGVAFSVGPERARLELTRADAPGLRRIAFEMESEAAFDALVANLSMHGVAATQDPQGLRLVDEHTGARVEFWHPGRVASAPTSAGAITGFGHVVLMTPAYREAVSHWRDILGFRLSDEIDGRISLLRCFPNPQHHSLGIASGPRRRFHHLNFRVRNDADFGALSAELARAGAVIASGPGIHAPSASRFVYFFDPDGLTVEAATVTELFAEGAERAPRVLPDRPESFALGDVRRHERMFAVGEIGEG